MNSYAHKLIEYCRRTPMSYSYKPVLIMAIVEHGGVLRIDEAVDYFIKYYGQRLSEGLIAERADSIFSTLRCTREKIASNIKANPVNALLHSEFFDYDRSRELLSVKIHYWLSLSPDDKAEITNMCLIRLTDYYARISTDERRNIICFSEPDAENDFMSDCFYAPFNVRGIQFNSLTQYMTYHKAVQCEDSIVQKRALGTDNPAALRRISAGLNGNEQTWRGSRQIIAYNGLMAKFSQNDKIRNQLLETGCATLAECRADDTIWSTGLSIDDERRFYIENWPGSNLMGFSLMQVRSALNSVRL
jgi:ribA/ribD-fused uncharacterized protein